MKRKTYGTVVVILRGEEVPAGEEVVKMEAEGEVRDEEKGHPTGTRGCLLSTRYDYYITHMEGVRHALRVTFALPLLPVDLRSTKKKSYLQVRDVLILRAFPFLADEI